MRPDAEKNETSDSIPLHRGMAPRRIHPQTIPSAAIHPPTTSPQARTKARNSLCEFQYDGVHRETVAFLGVDLLHHPVAFGTQHVFHLHRLDHGERLSGLDLLPLRH